MTTSESGGEIAAEAASPKRYVPEGLTHRWIGTGVALAKIVREAPLTLVLVAPGPTSHLAVCGRPRRAARRRRSAVSARQRSE